MSARMEQASDTPLFNYTIASADMRYIEIGERVLYLRADPQHAPLVRGEIPGCGPGCYVDLSQVFLEFTMSCEGCREEDVVDEALVYFGERLGTLISSRLYPADNQRQTVDRLTGIFDCVFRSMKLPYSLEQEQGRLHYSFASCPFCDNQAYAGFTRSMDMARLGFIALCESILHNIAPGWVLEKPAKTDINNPLLEVVLIRY